MIDLVEGVGDVMPIVMTEDKQMEIVFQTCVQEKIVEKDGFLLHISLTGKALVCLLKVLVCTY